MGSYKRDQAIMFLIMWSLGKEVTIEDDKATATCSLDLIVGLLTSSVNKGEALITDIAFPVIELLLW